MAGSPGGREGRRERGAVPAVFENGFATFIGTGADGEGTAAGRFQPLGAVAFPPPHEASTRPEALWGMGTRGKKALHHACGGGPTVGRPPQPLLRGPFCVMLVGGGHVRSARAGAPVAARAQRTRHAGPWVEELYHSGAHAPLELLLDEGIGHGIGVAFDFHVRIEVDARAFPLRLFIGLGRQGR
jgi:hypothetical protein